ncbi:MAG: 2-C-methyl-D-erythritol 2,4-cyclodiphosphate synthase, partial [Chloroflexota bacterium]
GGRPFVLGGVTIPHAQGPAGHSDGDPLLHALIDALLGAAGLGDIGSHFPPSDPQWRDAPSGVMLERVLHMVRATGLTPHNVDSTIVAERPILAPHIAGIRASVARLLGVNTAMVNVKAKTNEGLDSLGQGRAVAAHVVVLLAEA